MAWYEDDFEQYCESNRSVQEEASLLQIIKLGQIPTLLHWGYSPLRKLMDWQADLDEETIDWRAVCGKTARTVRREGKVKTFLYPYHTLVVWITNLCTYVMLM